jgi:hypothetical protein
MDIEEICDSADKQLNIEIKLNEIADKWATEEFHFFEWKGRGLQILQGTQVTIEQLEEDQMNLQTMLTMRHVTPFKQMAQDLLKMLSDTSETLELWLKVQMLWCSLESVFLGGDIARQMPVVAKKFVKIDKDWVKIMAKVRGVRGPACAPFLCVCSLGCHSLRRRAGVVWSLSHLPALSFLPTGRGHGEDRGGCLQRHPAQLSARHVQRAGEVPEEP